MKPGHGAEPDAPATPPRDWQVRALSPEDAPAMRRLFEDVFGQPMSASHWQWKYGDGAGRGIGVWHDGRLIAHYGGVQRMVLDAGTPCIAVQITDVAVTMRERGHLTRRGPYFLATSTFLDRYIGAGKPYLYGFGFPSERHFRLANLLGLYDQSDRIVEFSLAPAQGANWQDCPAMPMREFATNQRRRRAADAAWDRMRRELHPLLIGVRDADYLRRRYAAHPHYHYDLLAIRRLPFLAPHAFAVVRNVPDSGLEWLDLVSHPGDIPMLAAAVRRHAHRIGARRVFGWITASQQGYFTETGADFLPTEVVVPASSWCDEPTPATQKDRWWLMAGDTDSH